MKFTRRIAIPVLSAVALLGSGGIAYANVNHPTPTDTPTPTPVITTETPTPTPTPTEFRFPRIPIFCYFRDADGVQGSFVEYNWDHERTCPSGLYPIYARDLLRGLFFGPFPVQQR